MFFATWSIIIIIIIDMAWALLIKKATLLQNSTLRTLFEVVNSPPESFFINLGFFALR